MIQLELTATGVTLFCGYEQSWASGVVRTLVAQHLIAGGKICSLVDYDTERNEIESAMHDYLRAIKSNLDVVSRLEAVTSFRMMHVAADLANAIMQKMKHREGPLMVIRDASRSTLQTLPGATVLSQLDEVAMLLDVPILIGGHFGPAPQPKPDLDKYKADALWECEAGKDLTVKITRHRPAPKLVVKAKGKVMPYGQIEFSNIENTEFSHAE